MAAQLRVACKDPGKLIGAGSIELLIDGTPTTALTFGNTTTLAVAPGSHTAQVVLRAVLTRTSKALTFTCAEGETLDFVVTYSRLWGSMSIARQ